jgi:GxxExxY protein
MRTPESGKALLHGEVTGAIIHAAHAVHNILGCGLLEKVYVSALEWELTLDGMKVGRQVEFPVIFREKNIGIYYADLVVDQAVIVEVKAVDAITDAHRAQLINYLRISGLRVGLIINFAKKRLEYERLIV